MHTLTHPSRGVSKTNPAIIFVLGAVLLIGTWRLLYWWEAEFFAEPLLAGYYCCATEKDLPTTGTTERALSDLFHTTPGEYLPSLFLVAVSAALFGVAVRRTGWLNGWLPLVFVYASILYLVADLGLVLFSSPFVDAFMGPKTGPYQGLDRTWVGIVRHLLLWAALFIALSKLPARLKVRM